MQLERETKELDCEIHKSTALFDQYMDWRLSDEQFDALNTLVRGCIGALTRTKEELQRKSAMRQQECTPKGAADPAARWTAASCQSGVAASDPVGRKRRLRGPAQICKHSLCCSLRLFVVTRPCRGQLVAQAFLHELLSLKPRLELLGI